MGNTEETLDLIKLLIDHENRISDLYKEYAIRLPDSATFWSELAVEEKGHAAQLRRLRDDVEEERLSFDAARFDANLIHESVDCVDQEIHRAQEGEITSAYATTTALVIEKRMIEERFFDTCQDDSKEARQIFNGLRQLTRNHVERLADHAKGEGI